MQGSSNSYSNPQMIRYPNTVYKNYGYEAPGSRMQDGNITSIQRPLAEQYPSSAAHARFSVMTNCKSCNSLAMTEVERKHGKAANIWGLLLLPLCCMGAWCVCLEECRDVEHTCGYCHAPLGTNKTTIC